MKQSILLLAAASLSLTAITAQGQTPPADPATPPPAAEPAPTPPPATDSAPPASAPAPAPAPTPAEAPAAAQAPAATGSIAPPPAGKAQVVFFRPGSIVGVAIRCTVRINGEQMVGRVGSGDFFVATVDPGAYAFTAATEAKDIVNIEAEAGETYYIQCKIAPGIMAGRPNLSPAQAADFEKMAAKLDRVPDEQRAKLIAEDDADRAKTAARKR